jgi:RNA polymerase sigma-70 factor (ECF subfamily)
MPVDINLGSLQSVKAESATSRDSRLASAALAGSADAFGELQQLYSKRLYSTIFRIIKNREDAEDVLQETFMRAYLALHTFENRSSFYSWLTRIGINCAFMVLRKRRARPEILSNSSCESEGDNSRFEVKDPSLNPEQILDQRQRCAKIERAIRRLDSSLRVPLETRMVHDSSLGDIAEALDISLSSVKSRLFRARVRLRTVRVFKNSERKQPVSSGSRRKMPIAGFQNREQSWMNCGQSS